MTTCYDEIDTMRLGCWNVKIGNYAGIAEAAAIPLTGRVFEMEGQKSTESGRDVYAFTRSEGRWLAFWRAMLPD